MMEVTNSEVQTYKNCPNLHGLKFVELLEPMGPDPDAEPDAAGFGRLAHVGMSAAWESTRQGVSTFPGFFRAAEGAVRAVAGDNDGGVVEVLRVAIRGQLRELTTHKLIATEQSFALKVAGVIYKGQIDLITEHDGQLVVWDHKFSSQIDAWARRAQLDTQKFGYVKAVEKRFGRPVNRYVWSITRRKEPSRPRVLLLTKQLAAELGEHGAGLMRRQESEGEPMGLVSVAACDTTPEVYLDALLDQQVDRGIDISVEQQAKLDELKAAYFGKWYAQEETYVSPADMQRWESELRVVVRRMREDAKPGAVRYRNPDNCTSPGRKDCDWRTVCLNDTPETRALYQIRTSKHQELTSTPWT